MIKLHNFFKKILIAIFAISLATPCFAEMGDMGDIGDYGMWATEQNKSMVNERITDEVKNFAPSDILTAQSDIPLEAKIGLAFMGGMSKIGTILDNSLLPFAIAFILLAYAFWVAFEAYNLIGSGADAKQVVHDILIKGIWIAVWLIVLKFGIAKTFAAIMMPIVGIGGTLANFIFDSVTSVAGVHVTDYCQSIKDYAVANINIAPGGNTVSGDAINGLKITSESAAQLICIPTQMSSFFMTTMNIGWKWIIGGIGFSLFSILLGIYVIYLSLKCIWKYLFISLGVIADVFLSLLMMPFTAIAETTAKTKYKGVAGDIFNSFLDIFKAESLEKQITRIVTAAVYFVCLAISIGVSLALLEFVINPGTGQISMPTDINDGLGGMMILVLCLLLVCYMADKTKSLADSWAGKIDTELGDRVKKDATKLWDITKKRYKQLRDLKKK